MPGKIIGFLIAPLATPIVFTIGKLLTESTYEISDLFGIFINYGIYAYIFTLTLGIPTLVLLVKIDRLQLVHFIIAGFILSAGPCLFFYFVFGIVRAGFYLQCIFATLLSTIVFWLIAFGKNWRAGGIGGQYT